MKLSSICNAIGELYCEDIEISSLCFDSKRVTLNALFFCLVGSKDGHDFAAEAVEKGAVALVCQRRLESLNVPQIIVEDTRIALAYASAEFYNNPQKEMKMIGITGTNGKTTTSYVLASILKEYGLATGVIGTNGAVYGKKNADLTLTTPDPPQLFGLLRDMADSGVECVVMEVSAHALALGKVLGIVFDVAAFTNLSQDHLDYFADMKEYAAAKAKLFTPLYCKCAVINVDDDFGLEIYSSAITKTITYGCKNPSDVFQVDLKMGVGGLEYLLNLMDDVTKIKFSLTGRFNMYNSLCAAAIAGALGVPIKTVAEGIRKVKRVDGRYDIINTSKCSVIIDFAHTEDGLRNIISSIREYAPSRIITVFGCGGDRDRKKRPSMGQTAASLSDLCVITSDNPRSESPDSIIGDIIKGIEERGLKNYVTLADRKQAIKYALSNAGMGDIVLIAGKGAEKYQEIHGVKHNYNDGEYVMSLIEESSI